jgi:hypothetical protein
MKSNSHSTLLSILKEKRGHDMALVKEQMFLSRKVFSLSFAAWEKKTLAGSFTPAELEKAMPEFMWKAQKQQQNTVQASVPGNPVAQSSPVPSLPLPATARVQEAASLSAALSQPSPGQGTANPAAVLVTASPSASKADQVVSPGSQQADSSQPSQVLQTPPASPLPQSPGNNTNQRRIIVEDEEQGENKEEEEEGSEKRKTPKKKRRSYDGGNPGRGRRSSTGLSPTKVPGSSGTEENSLTAEKQPRFRSNGHKDKQSVEEDDDFESDQVINDSQEEDILAVMKTINNAKEIAVVESPLPQDAEIIVKQTPLAKAKDATHDLWILSLSRKCWSQEFLTSLAGQLLFSKPKISLTKNQILILQFQSKQSEGLWKLVFRTFWRSQPSTTVITWQDPSSSFQMWICSVCTKG